MTNQEAFTLIVQHLRTQGVPAVNATTGCVYRHKDGIRRCAVGVLIPDEEYDIRLEGFIVEEIYDKVPAFQAVSQELLSAMQNAHDSWTYHKWDFTWIEEQYTSVAERFGLVVPTHPCAEPAIAEVESVNLSREEVRL